MNAIYIRRRSKVLLPEGPGVTPLPVLAAFQKNVENPGFLLGEDIIDGLTALSPLQVDSFYRRLVKDLQTLVGANREFKPFYPGFPQQVMEMTEAELYFNAIRHYWTLERPDQPAPDRRPLEDRPKYRVLHVGTKAEFDGLFTLLVRSKSPFSPQDKTDVRWFVTQYRETVTRLLPDALPCRENLAVLGAELLRHAPAAAAALDTQVRTATDVLRLAVALSEGDVSLAETCKFGKFRRRDRARLLGWVERSPNRTEDLLRWKPRWIRLGERLHPGEYAKRFPETAAAFEVLRNGRPYQTFNGRVEAALAAADTLVALEQLAERPGDFARRLDHLARTSPAP